LRAERFLDENVAASGKSLSRPGDMRGRRRADHDTVRAPAEGGSKFPVQRNPIKSQDLAAPLFAQFAERHLRAPRGLKTAHMPHPDVATSNNEYFCFIPKLGKKYCPSNPSL